MHHYFLHFLQLVDLWCYVDIVEPLELAAVGAETSTAALQLVANRPVDMVDHSDPVPDGTESHNREFKQQLRSGLVWWVFIR